MSAALNIGHKLIAGGLITLSVAGAGAVSYGAYRLIYVKPRELAALQAAGVSDLPAAAPIEQQPQAVQSPPKQ